MKTDIVRYFRNAHIPAYVRNKSQLIAYVLVKYRNSEPISNGEFVFDLRCTRFGGVIHNLRKDGWDIATLKGKEAGHSLYYLVSKPDDELSQDTTLKLI
tara:strand:+ start:390 stop:686 length:297 start_codon:yes stop_codon:yes gene_type:complete